MTEIADFLITTIPIRWIRMLKIAGENVGLSGLPPPPPPPFFKKRCNPTVVQAQLLIYQRMWNQKPFNNPFLCGISWLLRRDNMQTFFFIWQIINHYEQTRWEYLIYESSGLAYDRRKWVLSLTFIDQRN